MRQLYLVALSLALTLLAATSAAAQEPLILAFPDTPCDSVSCGAITIVDAAPASMIPVVYQFRDGVSFSLDTRVVGSDTIAAGAPVRIPVCFHPTRRGQSTDSLLVVLRSGNTADSFRIRVTGRGIGPEIEPDPFVLNFPRTNPGLVASMPVTLRNVGELPYTFDLTMLRVPPPFRLATPGPITIPPGGAISIDLEFAPDEAGVYSAGAELSAGCALRTQIGLNGATDLVGTGAVLRLSKVRFNPINEEETPCSVERCTPVTISNAGNAPLIIEEIDWARGNAGYAITSTPGLPVTVGPNSQMNIEVCLDGKGRGRIIDTLFVTSNSRTSIAFGMVLDFSGSMDSLMNCGTGFTPRRIDQAIEQAQRFIGRALLHLPAVGVQDHLTLMRYSFSTAIEILFPLQPITDATRMTAQNVLNGLEPVGGTHTGAALTRMMDELLAGPLDNRVIVLLSDGAATDTNRHTVRSLTARATALGIRIFTIGIGTDINIEARNYLKELADNSGGVYFDGNDCGTLQQAFESITDLVSRGQIAYEPFSMKVTSPLVVTSGDVVFDSTYYLATTCRPVTLTNVGEGDALIDSIALRDALGATSSEFAFGGGVTFPIRIPESGQTQVEICFTPTGLRQRSGNTEFSYNSCATDIIASRLVGTGWATAALRIDDERIGLPGSTATMPVYLDSTLAPYEVATVTFEARWNKSMLDLRGVRPLASAGTGSVALAGPVRFEGRDAVASFVATGDFQQPAGPLAELDFLVLRGDTLASDIALSALRFEDDNPKPLMRNAGMIAFDSTCFRSTKSVKSAPGAAKLVHVEASPIPARRGSPLTLSLRADGITTADVSVYTSSGALVLAPERHTVTGVDRAIVLSASVAAGTYFIVVEDGAGATHVRSIVIVE